jgi:hypothetical protein
VARRTAAEFCISPLFQLHAFGMQVRTLLACGCDDGRVVMVNAKLSQPATGIHPAAGLASLVPRLLAGSQSDLTQFEGKSVLALAWNGTGSRLVLGLSSGDAVVVDLNGTAVFTVSLPAALPGRRHPPLTAAS